MSWKSRIIEWLGPFDLLWDRLKRHLKTRKGSRIQSPVKLMAYRGFCNVDRVWLKGRVLEDRLIVARQEDSAFRNFINTYKRFSSREIWGANLKIQIGKDVFQLQTDREGYFELDKKIPKNALNNSSNWVLPIINLIDTPWIKINQQFQGEMLFPKAANFGIISDIDDTIIRTGVASRLMWRAIYRTILKNASSRVIFKEASAFFRALCQVEGKPAGPNPVFYVSNSPWNLYDPIKDFLTLHDLPKGPILLRDLGLPADPRPDGYKGNKYESIARIFRTYPQLNFVLIGDSGERDTDIYLELTQDFPGRVKAIYIRDVQHQGRTKRVKALISNSGRTEVKLLNHFGEAVPHANNLGLLQEDIYLNFLNNK